MFYEDAIESCAACRKGRTGARFNDLIALWNYSPAVKARMIQLLLKLEIYRDDNGIV